MRNKSGRIGLSIDRERFIVEADGEQVILSPIEFRILDLLMSLDGAVASSAQIVHHARCEPSSESKVGALAAQHIRRLRVKIGGFRITTVSRNGYQIHRREHEANNAD